MFANCNSEARLSRKVWGVTMYQAMFVCTCQYHDVCAMVELRRPEGEAMGTYHASSVPEFHRRHCAGAFPCVAKCRLAEPGAEVCQHGCPGTPGSVQ